MFDNNGPQLSGQFPAAEKCRPNIFANRRSQGKEYEGKNNISKRTLPIRNYGSYKWRDVVTASGRKMLVPVP